MPDPDASPTPRVVQLSAKIANQIAAGEVVARPASVVKELAENAVDAGATRIRIEIHGGGIERVRVIDDGHGMDADNARLAMQRHATSKLRTVDDLRSIETMGFRGEALPSIASVGRFTMRTRTRASAEGIELSSDGGESIDVKPCGCAPGTTIELADLFFNVPARRKFLRAVSTESAHVTEAVRDLALAHPTVGFELVRDGRRSKRWLPVASRAERVANVFEDMELIVCEGDRGPVVIEAHLSRPERARNGATGLSVFVCNRPVRDRALARAVASAYGEALDRGKFPCGALYVDIPLDLVDVNVHPQKAEVRFAHARAVTDAVYSVVSKAVAAHLELPLAPKTEQHPNADRPKYALPNEPDEHWAWTPPSESKPDETQRFLGIANKRFLIFDAGTALHVVDGRKARALALRERLDAELSRGQVVAQRLLFPVAQTCTSTIADAAEQASAAFERLGFELRRTGPDHIAAHTVPRLLAEGPADAMVAAVLDAGARAAEPPFGIDAPALLDTLAGLAAKHAAPPLPTDLDDDVLAEARVSVIDYADLS